MLTDSSGEVTGTFSYTALGRPASSTGTETTPLGYAGQLTNESSGLQYLRARVYDPGTGQFLSRDPMSDVTGVAYAYAGNNPINGYDPSGLCNANPFSGGFWTEGNCISESPANPIPYYEREIEAWEAGCSYWESIQYGFKGAAVLAADSAGLYGVVRAAAGRAAAAGVDVVFGHGSRHLAGTGLAQAEVEAAIQSQVASQMARASAAGGFWGRVVVNGQTISYRAYVLPDGTVNVGTYYVVP
ncbi:MAG TPA: RHS repeat-associated core domain-containing protein [Solirubrobacterales bacterium]